MYFSFKNTVEDFLVEEQLDFSLSGSGDFFYIFFEKEKLNTMDILMEICGKFGVKRDDLWIAGLKDKQGITRQRLSISKKRLKAAGGETQFLDFLKSKVKILETWWHETPLAVGKNKGNRFKIRLRRREELPEEKKKLLEEQLEISKKIWFPNAFWIQRFGKGNKNYKKAEKLFNEGLQGKIGYEVKFKLQAFGSMRFNELVMKRREEKAFLLEGDILVNGWNAFWTWVANYMGGKLQHFDYWKLKEQLSLREVEWNGTTKPLNEYHTVFASVATCPEEVGKQSSRTNFWTAKVIERDSDYNASLRFPTGAVLGMEQLLCLEWTEARSYDDWQIQESWFLKFGSEISRNYQLYGFRRPLWVKPTDLEWKREEGDLLLSFFLPTGSYASVFLASILGGIDPKGCESNGLIIPRIEWQNAL